MLHVPQMTRHLVLIGLPNTIGQSFCFQNYTKYFWDTFTQRICFPIIKMIHCRGDFTDISAKTATLMIDCRCRCADAAQASRTCRQPKQVADRGVAEDRPAGIQQRSGSL